MQIVQSSVVGPAALTRSLLQTPETDYEDEHEAFAASRSTDFIYESGNESAFGILDGHAETMEGDSKLPFVITGSPGCGKSALLANWMNRRRSAKHRDEFLFQHYVGCSPRSKQLAHLLYRLESALKEHFQLREMEVPTSEERLRWSLYRFLAAAAKKQNPARIVIVLDAVNRLRGDSSAADTLHWLPTDLPPGVRIIVSTLELEHYSLSPDDIFDEGTRVHRTYTELRRRRCPTIRLQPLTVEVRHQIISSFLRENRQILASIEQAQQFRLVTAKASSQPLFLRIILYALRIGTELSEMAIDHQIDTYLKSETSTLLLARVLASCSLFVVASGQTSHDKHKLHEQLGGCHTEASSSSMDGPEGCSARFLEHNTNALAQVLTAMYASRHGLSETEMWGIVGLATGTALLFEERSCIRRVLHDYTFSVKGLRSFSHEDFAAVVYREYIRTPEIHIRSHQLMARYFGKLPPCHRKLDALPYHLEVSGSWSRLRTALVDVRMFQLWWTPTHKTEFLSLWASLTADTNRGAGIRKLVTGEFNETMRCNQPSRPCLDIVEEYVRSVDDFKFAHAPDDNELASVVLHIADFMLEFATLCLEDAADVPQFIHPVVPNDDFASLGVPFLVRDKDGNSVLRFPYFQPTLGKPSLGSKYNGIDVPMKVNEHIPVCSTYFYHRWMWIQFPLVSLANCGERYLYGCQSAHSDHNGLSGRLHTNPNTRNHLSSEPPKRPNSNVEMYYDSSRTRFPNLKIGDGAYANQGCHGHHTELAAAATRAAVGKIHWHSTMCSDHMMKQIDDWRSQLDKYRQERKVLECSLVHTRDELAEIQQMQLSTADLELQQDHIASRLEDVRNAHQLAQLLSRNYDSVRLVCERHRAHSPALIDELESKIRQDTLFIEIVRQKLRDIKSHLNYLVVSSKTLHRTVQDTIVLHNGLLVQRMRQRDTIASSATTIFEVNTARVQQHAKRPNLVNEARQHSSDFSRYLGNQALTTEQSHESEANQNCRDASTGHGTTLLVVWEDNIELIRKRTFITDVNEFLSKFYNAQHLQNQMSALHNCAETRHRGLKAELIAIEGEFEQVRYNSQSVLGLNSREARELQLRLSLQLGRHKRASEGVLTAERLRQDAFRGIKHVCNTLGIPHPDQDTPVNEIMHQVESVLEALMEEKDKTSQRLGECHQSSFREASSGYDKLMRTPELDAALGQFETPKALIAHVLSSRPDAGRLSDDCQSCSEDNDEGSLCSNHDVIRVSAGDVASRSELKREAQKSYRAHRRLLVRPCL